MSIIMLLMAPHRYHPDVESTAVYIRVPRNPRAAWLSLWFPAHLQTVLALPPDDPHCCRSCYSQAACGLSLCFWGLAGPRKLHCIKQESMPASAHQRRKAWSRL